MVKPSWVKRGKRKGKAPVELLTGKPLEKPWIDLLMDKIKAAFTRHNVCSLKQLHQIICTKEPEESKAQKAVPPDRQAVAVAV